MENETLEAKLRNQLSPIYSLADMILLMEEKPEIKNLLIKQAKQVVTNKEKIDLLLAGIEAKTLNKPDVTCCAFLDWVNLHTHFWKSPHMKLWYDKSKFYGEKGFTTMELYELFVAQHST